MKNEKPDGLVLKIGPDLINNRVPVIDVSNPRGKDLGLNRTWSIDGEPEKLAADLLIESMNRLFKPGLLGSFVSEPKEETSSFELSSSSATGIFNIPKIRMSHRNAIMSHFQSLSITTEVLRRPIPGRNEFDLLVASTDNYIRMDIVQGQKRIYTVGEYGSRHSEFTSSTHLVDGDSLATMVLNHNEVRHSEGPPIEEMRNDKFWKIYMDDALKLSSVAHVSIR